MARCEFCDFEKKRLGLVTMKDDPYEIPYRICNNCRRELAVGEM